MNISFSQSEYTVSESNSTFQVQLNKNKRLANPLEVVVTALTLEEAYYLGCIHYSTYYEYEFQQAGILYTHLLMPIYEICGVEKVVQIKIILNL